MQTLRCMTAEQRLLKRERLRLVIHDEKNYLVSETVHPESRDVVTAYAAGQSIEVVTIPQKDGVTDIAMLEELMDDQTAAVLVQYPNFFGQVEDIQKIGEIAHDKGGLFVVSANPLAFGVLTPPGKLGADITVGDAQPFGISEAIRRTTLWLFRYY